MSDSASDEAKFQRWLTKFSYVAEEEVALARSAFYAGLNDAELQREARLTTHAGHAR